MKSLFLLTSFVAAASASVLIQGAMPSEVAVLKAACTNAKTTSISAYEFTQCQIENQNVIISKTLVGEINASIATTLALQNFKDISLVINQGTAGSHDRSIKRGEILLADKIYNFAAYLTPRTAEHKLENREKMQAPLRLGDEGKVQAPKFYSSDVKWLEKANLVAKELNILTHVGAIASSDAFNREAQMIDYIHKNYNSSAEEMESIAAAQTAAAFNIPYLAVRVISNNELLGEDFDENTAKISQNLVIQMLKNMKD